LVGSLVWVGVYGLEVWMDPKTGLDAVTIKVFSPGGIRTPISRLTGQQPSHNADLAELSLVHYGICSCSVCDRY
jgi:hypothetical protein